MRKAIIIAALLLTGCITKEFDYSITRPDVVYIGDSLCWRVFDTDNGIKDVYEREEYKRTAQAQLGMVSNCVPGRRAQDLKELPKGYRIGFLALGSNDVGKYPVEQFAANYQALVDSSDYDTLYCVLPAKSFFGVSAKAHRDAIISICPNVIDPLEHGIGFRADDTVHMDLKDHKIWRNVLVRYL